MSKEAAVATNIGAPAESVVLSSVRWQTYEHLLADLADCSAPRLTFDRGTLEIMSPTAEHEKFNRTLAALVDLVAMELGIACEGLGSTTFRREDLQRGFEPDSCFYIQNAERIRGKSTLDLKSDPPPDLIIEIDITRSSVGKFPIYAQLAVPEVWRFDGRALMISRLSHGEYVPTERSLAFPLLTASVLSELLERSKTVDRTTLLRSFREWIRESHPL